MNYAGFGYVQQSVSQPCPVPGKTVGKSIQEKSYSLKSEAFNKSYFAEMFFAGRSSQKMSHYF